MRLPVIKSTFCSQAFLTDIQQGGSSSLFSPGIRIGSYFSKCAMFQGPRKRTREGHFFFFFGESSMVRWCLYLGTTDPQTLESDPTLTMISSRWAVPSPSKLPPGTVTNLRRQGISPSIIEVPDIDAVTEPRCLLCPGGLNPEHIGDVRDVLVERLVSSFLR